MDLSRFINYILSGSFYMEVVMILLDNLVLVFLCCYSASNYPGEPSLPIDHGKFHFSAPTVHFLEERKLGVDFMIRVEKLINENPGKGDIQYDERVYFSVVGMLRGERHNGCFRDDEKCRITSLLEMPK